VLATRTGALPWQAVAAEPLVIFPRTIAPSLFDAVLAAYRAHGATPRIGQEAIQMQTIVNLVSAGMGLAWVPESVTRLQRPGVAYRAVADAGLRCETSLVWRADAPPVVARFVAHVLAQIAALGAAAALATAAAAGAAAQQRQSAAGESCRPDDDSECC
jgi:DNA-binding transcriptional LysR family regulator